MAISFYIGGKVKKKGEPVVNNNDNYIMCVFGETGDKTRLVETLYDNDPNKLMKELADYCQISPYAEDLPQVLDDQPVTGDSIFLKGLYQRLSPENYEKVKVWVQTNAKKFKKAE